MDRSWKEIFCKRCGSVVLICQACFREQRYCSSLCSSSERLKQKRAAQKRYKDSTPEFLEDRKKYQKRYRKAQKELKSQNSGVTDPSSSQSTIEVATTDKQKQKTYFCSICGTQLLKRGRDTRVKGRNSSRDPSSSFCE